MSLNLNALYNFSVYKFITSRIMNIIKEKSEYSYKMKISSINFIELCKMLANYKVYNFIFTENHEYFNLQHSGRSIWKCLKQFYNDNHDLLRRWRWNIRQPLLEDNLHFSDQLNFYNCFLGTQNYHFTQNKLGPKLFVEPKPTNIFRDMNYEL